MKLKKSLIPVLALSAMLLVSPSVFAAQPDATFTCPNQNVACTVKGACVNNGQCVNAPVRGCSRLRNVAASAGKQAAADTSATEFVCPRANEACIQNGACVNDGQCQPSANCPNNGVPKRDGTGGHHGGQGRGHRGGNCGR